jgi:tetratricopeptide (TPR) repeat protein
MGPKARVWLTVVVACALGTPALADSDAPASKFPYQRYLELLRGADPEAAKAFAKAHAADAWGIVDGLFSVAATDAAESFATALADGDHAKAVRAYVASWRGRPDPSEAREAYRLALERYRAGKKEEALESLTRAAAAVPPMSVLSVRIDDLRTEVLSDLRRLGDAGLACGHAGLTAKSLGWAALATDALVQARDFTFDACLHRACAQFLLALRDIRDAEHDLEGIADADHGLGSCFESDSSFEQARKRFVDSLLVYRQLGRDVKVSEGCGDLAGLDVERGEFQSAGRWLREAESELRGMAAHGDAAPPSAVAGIRMREGVLAYGIGELDRADVLLQEAVRGFEGTDDLVGAGLATANRGLVLLARGRWDEAVTAVETAAEMLEKRDAPGYAAQALSDVAGAHARAAAVALRAAKAAEVAGHLAEAVSLRGQAGEHLERAEKRVVPAIEKATEYGLTMWIARARETRGEIRFLRGRYDEAIEDFRFARNEASRNGANAFGAETVAWLARAHAAKGEWNQAVEQARQAAHDDAQLSEGSSEGYRSRAATTRADAYETGAVAAAHLDRTAEVAFFLETGRAHDLVRALGGRSALGRAAIPAERIAAEEAAAKAKGVAIRAYLAKKAEGTTGLGDLWDAYEAAREKERQVLEATDEEVRAAAERIAPPRVESAEDVGRRLRGGDAFVEIGLFADDALAVVVEKPEAPPGKEAAPTVRWVALPRADEIRDLVEKLDVDREEGPRRPKAADDLRRALVDRLGLAPWVKRVLVSPSGETCYVPFRLLLPDAVALVYEPSGTLLNLLREDQERTGRGTLALADPVYDGAGSDPDAYVKRGGPRLGPLPKTRDEAASIPASEHDARRLGAQATEAELRAILAKDPRRRWHVAHFACHGLVDVERPAYSSLALTPSGDDDGFLTALEAFRLRLPTDLAVLSACSTGRGPYARGEGIIGLVRAFMHAGAPRVLVSEWDVDDAATLEVMRAFYARWKPGETGPAEALRLAQLHVRDFVRKGTDGKDERPWADPKHWAAWSLWGLPD